MQDDNQGRRLPQFRRQRQLKRYRFNRRRYHRYLRRVRRQFLRQVVRRLRGGGA